MKKLIVILLAFAGVITQAKVYYVSPYTGRDSNAGTDTANAWATWGKAFTSPSVIAGDTVYFRGGVYMMPYDNGTGYRMTKTGTKEKPICFFAYPEDFDKGVFPILDCKNVTVGYKYSPSNFYGVVLLNCKYINIKGLTVRNVLGIGGGNESTYGFMIENCVQITLEQCTCYNTRFIGFYSTYSDSTFFVNCDSYEHCDSFRSFLPGNHGYGFNDFDWTNFNRNTFYIGCRAWNCSDDGFSTGNCGLSSYENCWSFNNGDLQGEGHGFKMGWVEPLGVNAPLNRRYTNCLAAYNRSCGFVTNEDNSSDYTGSMEVYNNTAYHNGYYATRFPGSPTHGFFIMKGYDANTDHQLARIFFNNLSYDNEDGEVLLGSGALYTHSNNSWDSGKKLTADHFIDLDSSRAIAILKGPRKPGGSLPDLGNFLKLREGSDLINTGLNVGLHFNGSAPDIGCFESDYDNAVQITNIYVKGAGNAASIAINKGTLQLIATVYPSNATNQAVKWSVIQGSEFAVVSVTGLLTAVNNGTVRVKAAALDGSGVFGTLDVAVSNQHIPVSSISVSGEGGSAYISTDGGTLQLKAAVSPVDATNKNVIWSMVNESGKATISPTGLVTAVDNGIVTARATASDGSGIHEIFSITVSNQIIPVSDITVSGEGNASIITSIGGTLQLNAIVLPNNASDKYFTWSILNNTGQAVINSSGLVTAVAAGTVIAKATANDGTGIFGTLAITISEELIPVSDINISGENIMKLGELTSQLSAQASPDNATDRTISWSVHSVTGQATISSTGLVTALANGSVTAIATANDGSGVSESFDIAIASFPVTVAETKTIYIDPGNQDDLLQDGTLDHPFSAWSLVTWKEGYSYLQKKGTLSYESKINITSGNVTMGSYGEGEKPVIHSNVNDFAIRAYEKSNIFITELQIIAVNAISCIYIIGETSDNICIENCTLESAVNGARILDGKNVILRYNTFVNCSEAIYCYADNSTIYYNVFRDNEVAISAMASMANAQIYNNVFYNNTIGISNTYTDLTLYNNIFYLVNSSDKAIFNNQLNQLISDNNIFYPEQTGFIQIGSKIYSSLEEYQHELGLDLNSITDDPAFVDAFNQDFSVVSNSPAINAGKLIGLEHDFYGTRVPLGGIPDIGLAELRSYTTALSHLNDPNRDDFQVYPNPCQGVFNIFVRTNNAKDSRITIRDLTGKTVYENNYSSNFDFQQEIDISKMQKGIYIVAVEENDRSLSQPVIIQ